MSLYSIPLSWSRIFLEQGTVRDLELSSVYQMILCRWKIFPWVGTVALWTDFPLTSTWQSVLADTLSTSVSPPLAVSGTGVSVPDTSACSTASGWIYAALVPISVVIPGSSASRSKSFRLTPTCLYYIVKSGEAALPGSSKQQSGSEIALYILIKLGWILKIVQGIKISLYSVPNFLISPC